MKLDPGKLESSRSNETDELPRPEETESIFELDDSGETLDAVNEIIVNVALTDGSNEELKIELVSISNEMFEVIKMLLDVSIIPDSVRDLSASNELEGRFVCEELDWTFELCVAIEEDNSELEGRPDESFVTMLA